MSAPTENKEAAEEVLQYIEDYGISHNTDVSDLLASQVSALVALTHAVLYVGDQVGDIPG